MDGSYGTGEDRNTFLNDAYNFILDFWKMMKDTYGAETDTEWDFVIATASKIRNTYHGRGFDVFIDKSIKAWLDQLQKNFEATLKDDH